MSNLSEQEKKLRDMLEHMEVDFDPDDRSKARQLIRAAYPRFPFKLFSIVAAFFLVGAAAFYFYTQTDDPANGKTRTDNKPVNEEQAITTPKEEPLISQQQHNDKQENAPVPAAQNTISGKEIQLENMGGSVPGSASQASSPKDNSNDPVTGKMIGITEKSEFSQTRPGVANISVKEALENLEKSEPTTINKDQNTLAENDKPLAASNNQENKSVTAEEKSSEPVKEILSGDTDSDSVPTLLAKEAKPEKSSKNKEQASSKVKRPSNNTTGFGIFAGANYLNQLNASRSDKYTITPIGGILVSRTLGKQWELGLRAGYLQQTMGGYSRSSVKKVHHFGLETDSIAFSPQKLEYLQLGISIAYKFGKWQIYGGFYANNLLQASGNYTTYTKRPYKEDLVTEQKERGYTEGLRSWHAVYGLGAGYQFTDFLRVSAAVSRSATVPVESRYYPTSAAKPYQVYELSLYYELFRSR